MNGCDGCDARAEELSRTFHEALGFELNPCPPGYACEHLLTPNGWSRSGVAQLIADAEHEGRAPE